MTKTTKRWVRRLLVSPLLHRLLREGWKVADWGCWYDEDYDGDDEDGRPIVIPTSSPWLDLARGDAVLRFYRSRWGDASYCDGAPVRHSAESPEQFGADLVIGR